MKTEKVRSDLETITYQSPIARAIEIDLRNSFCSVSDPDPLPTEEPIEPVF